MYLYIYIFIYYAIILTVVQKPYYINVDGDLSLSLFYFSCGLKLMYSCMIQKFSLQTATLFQTVPSTQLGLMSEKAGISSSGKPSVYKESLSKETGLNKRTGELKQSVRNNGSTEGLLLDPV